MTFDCRKVSRSAFLRLAAGVVVVGLVACSQQTETGTTEPIRIGWQPPWANQGQLVEVLRHTDVLSKRGVRAEFQPFTYGGPMTEAALAGSLDVLLVGNQPAVTLMSKSKDWRIVARLPSYRSAIVVPSESPLHTVEDLRGKRLAVAFGSTTHTDVLRRLLEVGLVPADDVQMINLDQAEHASLLAAGGTTQWGEFDALATHDPAIAIAESAGAKVIGQWALPAVVVASTHLLTDHREECRAFFSAYVEAYTIYAADPGRFDKLYEADSGLPLSVDIYRKMASYEPNLAASALSNVDVRLDEDDVESLVEDADLAYRFGLIASQPDLRQAVDQSALP